MRHFSHAMHIARNARWRPLTDAAILPGKSAGTLYEPTPAPNKGRTQSMRALTTVVGACALVGFAFAATADEEGFKPLFNGENLDGWTVWGDPAGFEVVDGVIRSEPRGIGYGMYYHEREFSDFELRIEFRIPDGGNSGVFIRCKADGPPETNHPWIDAYEVQISYEDPPRADDRCTGSLYAYVPVDPRLPDKPDEWREFIIRAEGTHIKVWLDGTQIISFDQSEREDTRDKALSGHIAVQDNHGSDDTWVEFRNIRVKDLSEE